MTEEQKKTIVDEQFWFTATILGVNGFLISVESKKNNTIEIFAFSFLSFFAMYLVQNRSAKYARKFDLSPQKRIEESEISHRFRITKYEVIESLKHLPYIIFEFSGTLFYLSLILFSYLALLEKYNLIL
jgi:hypothetical protein